MKTLPASQVSREQEHLYSKLKEGPLILTVDGHEEGVLVQPALWNQLLERLEEQADLITALAVELEIERGETTFEPVDIRELKAWARGESIVPA
jgi:PHD/YefM family antitoxin component YafN of YafNO toxin-antitoxin module